MKNSIVFPSLLIVFLFFNFTLVDQDQKILLQKSLESEVFENIWPKDETGHFLSLRLVSDEHTSGDLSLQCHDLEIPVISSEHEPYNYLDPTLIYWQGKKQTSRKATLWFTYGRKKIKIKLAKVNGEWTFRSGTARGEGRVFTSFDF